MTRAPAAARHRRYGARRRRAGGAAVPRGRVGAVRARRRAATSPTRRAGPAKPRGSRSVSVNLPAAADGPAARSGARDHDERGRTGRVGRDRRHRGHRRPRPAEGGCCASRARRRAQLRSRRRRPRPRPFPGRGRRRTAPPELTGLELAPAHLHARAARSGDRAPWARGNRAALPAVTRGAGAIHSGPRRRRARGLRTEAMARPLRASGARRRTPLATGGRFSARGRRGLNRLRFSGRVRGRPLAPGALRPPGGCGRPRRAEIRGHCAPIPDRRRGLAPAGRQSCL